MPKARAKPKSKATRNRVERRVKVDLSLTGKLQLVVLVDEQILRLQVSMQDVVRVAESETPQQLVHEGLHNLR